MSVNRRRDRHDIVAEILNHAKRGRIKTHIMYGAKLSYSQINEYLNLLIDKGFLENMAVRQKKQVITVYRTTEKGREFLDHLESIDKIWNSEVPNAL